MVIYSDVFKGKASEAFALGPLFQGLPQGISPVNIAHFWW